MKYFMPKGLVAILLFSLPASAQTLQEQIDALDSRVTFLEQFHNTPPEASNLVASCDEEAVCAGDIGVVDEDPVIVTWGVASLTGFAGLPDGTWSATPVDGDNGVHLIDGQLGDGVHDVPFQLSITVNDTVNPASYVPNPDFTALTAAIGNCGPDPWCEVPGTVPTLMTHAEMVALDQARGAANPGACYQTSGPNSHFILWSGATFDGQQFVFLADGGHNAYQGSTVYAFDLNTLTWELLAEPATCSLHPEVHPSFDTPDWGRTPMNHTYDSGIYHPGTNQIITWAGSNCWRFDRNLVVNKSTQGNDAWKKCTDASTVWVRGGPPYKTALSPDGEIIVFGLLVSNISRYMPEDDPLLGGSGAPYTDHGGTFPAGIYGGYSVADTHVLRREVMTISVDYNGVYRLPIDITPGGTLQAEIIPGSTLPSGVNDRGCFVYIPGREVMWWWNGGRETWEFDPQADPVTWTQRPNLGGPSFDLGTYNGVMSKCAYIPEVDAVLILPKPDMGLIIYRF